MFNFLYSNIFFKKKKKKKKKERINNYNIFLNIYNAFIC